MAEKRAYQPIHESMRVRLDPEYVEFHDKVLQYVQPDDQIPWDPSCRSQPSVPMAMGAQKLVDVGDVQDHDLGDIQIRVFTPDVTTRPPQGWPTLVWLHGGGWVMGGLGSENGFLRHVCKCKKP